MSCKNGFKPFVRHWREVRLLYSIKKSRKRGENWVVKETGTPVSTQVEKMSKSRYNVVNPDDVVRAYGADSMRLYEMFMGPLDREKPWSDEGVQGVYRFMKRAWSLFINEDGGLHERIAENGEESRVTLLRKAIKQQAVQEPAA